MVVLVLSAAPAGLRGAITRWLLELQAGVFVGNLSARVREQLWELVAKDLGDGRALLLWTAQCEQGYRILSLGHERIPHDMDGLTLLLEPYRDKGANTPNRLPGAVAPRQESWSIAGRRRRFRTPGERALGAQ